MHKEGYLKIRREEMEEPLDEGIILQDIFYQHKKGYTPKERKTTIVGAGKKIEGRYILETRLGCPTIGKAIIRDHSLDNVEMVNTILGEELDKLIKYLNPHHRKNLEMGRRAPQKTMEKFIT